jgi:predicted nucleotide-binding protein (sugar kinase/HSP70/actin superfamily)
MFDPSIKKENLIVIEDNFEDSKVGIKEQAEIPLVHRKSKENKTWRRHKEKANSWLNIL